MLFALLACSGPCDADDLSSGSVSATIDGEAWSSNAAWSASGDAAQLTTDADGWRITLVLYEDSMGTTPSALEGEGPWTFPLTSGTEGGFALLYPEGGGSLSSEPGAGGSLELWVDGGDWLACFDVDAGDADGVTAHASGSVKAPAP